MSYSVDIKWTKFMENKEFESRSQQKRAPKCVCVCVCICVSVDMFWYVIERSLRVRNGNPLQYSCLENSMDRGSWQATVHGVTKSKTLLRD